MVEVFAEGARHETQNVILLASIKSWKPWLEDRFYAPDSWQAGLTGARIRRPTAPAARSADRRLESD